MADDSEILRTYPVVTYRRAQGPHGWMFRNADDETWHGPFADRDEAIAFGLQSISRDPVPVLRKASVRRAA